MGGGEGSLHGWPLRPTISRGAHVRSGVFSLRLRRKPSPIPHAGCDHLWGSPLPATHSRCDFHFKRHSSPRKHISHCFLKWSSSSFRPWRRRHICLPTLTPTSLPCASFTSFPLPQTPCVNSCSRGSVAAVSSSRRACPPDRLRLEPSL